MDDYKPSVLVEYDPGAIVHPVKGLPHNRELAFLGTNNDEKLYLLIRPERSAENLEMHLFVGTGDNLQQTSDVVFTTLLGGRALKSNLKKMQEQESFLSNRLDFHK